MKKSRANKGQFSVIAALLVSVILVTAVISTYTMVRHSSIQDSPEILTAIGEMNADIKQILDFTVGYYGSILQVTGNSTYANNLTTTYLSGGLVSIARSHPEWNPSFDLTSSGFSTSWFMPESFSMGNLSVTYSLESIGIEGVKYETSSALEVTMLESDSGVARILVTRDNSEPELGLSKGNFWFYNYTDDSIWELINPPSIIISSNGVYNITLPSGIDPDAYSVQIEDNRGLMVPAFYSPNSVASESKIPSYIYTFDWESTGMLDIYEALSTDTFAIELLQNGTLKWLGQPLEILPEATPIPPICIKAFHVNATINGVNQEVPFQVEDWASDYMVPLGLSSNESIFSGNNMFVFLVYNEISEITLWWNGNDTAIQTPYAWRNVYFTDDVTNPDDAVLDNGYLSLNVEVVDPFPYGDPEFVVTSSMGASTSTAEFLRISNEFPIFWADTDYIIYDGIVRDIVQQEPEYGGGATGCPNFYTQIVLTLPANATYYTYSLRTIFVDSVQPRTITDLSVIQLSGLNGDPLTEDGTSGGYPDTSDAGVSFSDGSPSGWDHHWSQFSNYLGLGSGVMFTDSSNEDLYVFDDVIGAETGAIVVDDWSNFIEVNPVELQQVTSFLSASDLTWYGAVVTFTAEPIHPDSGHDGLWVMVENPPDVMLDGYGTIPGVDFVDTDTSNVDSSADKGSHSSFVSQKFGPDSTFDTLTEATQSGETEDYVDNDVSNVDSSSDLGDLANFDNMQATDSTYATLTETSPASGITFVNEAEYTSSGSSAQVNKPSGTQENDFMIALLVSTRSDDNDGSTMSNAPSGWTLEHDYIQDAWSGQHVYIYWKIAGASEPSSYTWTWAQSCGWVAQISTFRGVDTNSPIHVEGAVNQENSRYPTSPSVTTTEDNCMIWLYDLCDGQVIPYGGGEPSGTSEIEQTERGNPGNGLGISTAYYVQASAGATGNRDWTLDSYEENSAQQYALKPASTECRLDQEVQWTGVPYSMANEYLSIYGGTMGAEDIIVDVWTGSGWQTVFTDLSPGWNNVSISSWLTSSTFTIRFRDGTEVGDSVQDTWQIDAALIHVYNEDNYELDLEVQWTHADFDEANEELCIYVGAVGGENLRVDVWTGSAWQNLFSSLNVGWNNVTVSSHLTSSTFTIRFKGATETGDTTQDYWTIDATLLHCWS